MPLPGFVMKRAIKGIMELNTDGLRKRVLEGQEGSIGTSVPARARWPVCKVIEPGGIGPGPMRG